MKALLLLLAGPAALALSACGIRGDLDRPAPLWGPGEQMDDAQIAEMLRRNFMRRINDVARTDIVHHLPETPIATLLHASADNDQAVVPICDSEGRLKGYCTSNALLRGLDMSLQAMSHEGSGDNESNGQEHRAGGPDNV